MKVREVKKSELNALKPILAESLWMQQPPSGPISSVDEIHAQLDKSELMTSYEGKIKYISAQEGGEEIGICVIYTYSDGFSKYADIRDLYVLEKHRGKGIGLQLMERALECAKEEGCSLMIALPPPKGQPVEELLGKVGFEKGEHTPFIKVLSSQ